jgi:hypothetical protein
MRPRMRCGWVPLFEVIWRDLSDGVVVEEPVWGVVWGSIEASGSGLASRMASVTLEL